MKATTNLELIKNAADSLTYTSIKKNFVSNLYWMLKRMGLRPVIVNTNYIEVDGVSYDFINRKRDMKYEIRSLQTWRYLSN